MKRSRWLVVTLGILSAFGPVSIDMYLPAFPLIAKDLQASPGAVQFTLSVFLIGFAVGQLLWGRSATTSGGGYRSWPAAWRSQWPRQPLPSRTRSRA